MCHFLKEKDGWKCRLIYDHPYNFVNNFSKSLNC